MRSDLDISEAKRRKRELVAIAILLPIVVVLSLVEYRLMAGKAGLPAWGDILIFAIINLNVLLILLIFYLSIRNIVKLVFEDKARLFGAKLRTKLVLAFIFMSLIPTAVLFFVSTQFVNTSLKLWFDERIERSLEDAILVGRTYYEEQEAWLKDVSARIAEGLSFKCSSFGTNTLSANCTEEWMDTHSISLAHTRTTDLSHLHVIQVMDRKGNIIYQKRSLGLPEELLPIPKEQIAQTLEKGGIQTFSMDFETGELLVAMIPLISSQGERIPGLLVTGYLMPQKVSHLLSNIKKGFEEYEAFKLYKDPLRSTVLITLFLITLLIIFVAMWFGFRLARHITEPLQALAEATYRVAQGDLDFALEAHGKDELNALVRAFNTMTQELKEAKRRAENASQKLKKSYAQLEQRQRYIEIILQNVATGVISIDKDGIVQTMNQSAEAILGMDAQKILGKPYQDLLSPIQAHEFEQIRREIFASAKGLVQRPMKVKVGEREISLIVTFTVLKDQEGRSHGVVVVFDDLTELEKIQRMAAWREVARRIAHEVKNPLTPIQLNAQRLQRKYGSRLQGTEGEVFRRCTEAIVKQVEELKLLVNEFSSFARMPSLRPRPTNLLELAEDVAFMYKDTHPLCKFHVKAHSSFPKTVLVDPDQMKRAIINLVDNAVHAMPEGGEVRVELTSDETNESITIEVTDTGSGIPEEDRPRLFEPYFSRRKGGTGLGLAIVNSIITDHGGTVSVSENTPNGTRFIMTIPLSGAGPDHQEPDHQKPGTRSPET